MEKQFYTANRQMWDKKTKVHEKADFYDLPAFKSGKSSLMPTELKELGDVSGKSLLHLQCHFGMDSLSWARQGAKVTAVDFSPKAIELAQSLSKELNIPGRFIQSNIFELSDKLDEQFDIIFTSYGVLCWLEDIDAWGKVISRYLRPGGTFYIVEFHPALMAFEFDELPFKLQYEYFHKKEPFVWEGSGSYADRDADISYTCYEWNHSISDIIMALINNGLSIELMHEFPFSHWNCFPNLVGEGTNWYFKDYQNLLPLMFSIKAKKQ